MSQSDRIYAAPRRHLVDFRFDQAVAEVFPDMIRRSVPGYDTIIPIIGVIAEKYHRPGRRVYDLGCSLGAATASMHRCLGDGGAEYIAVDSSAPMLVRCREILDRLMPAASLTVVEGDIREIEIRNAGVVTLNFTLQFLPPEDRGSMLERVYAGLEPGGALILSEKIQGGTSIEEESLTALHGRFKVANGYSDLEISQKRSALEKVMRLDTLAVHRQRLESAGFGDVLPWFQCLNFVSLLAIR
jgi:tRNA (cmo5U34)-methyltransferase